jgi:hypothetical protein
MNKIFKILLHTLPLMAGVGVSYFFWRSNTTLFIIYAFLVLALILAGKDKKVESLILAYGLIGGFAIETFGTHISGYQSFSIPQIWGIPYWLVVSWGYGFILMKRVGLIIATGSPWAETK